ncbi:MAG: transposase [Syntrophobacteraceae bacterium]
MQCRRACINGGTLFFTVVTHGRQHIFSTPVNVDLLRKSFRQVMAAHPFEIDAIVILPDHLHCIWTLPKEDADFSTRWRLIKRFFSKSCSTECGTEKTASRLKKGERGIWQRRFWEHVIRDETDFARHVEYIHYNPVKHGIVNAPKDWAYSSFHRYVRKGIYDVNWASSMTLDCGSEVGME